MQVFDWLRSNDVTGCGHLNGWKVIISQYAHIWLDDDITVCKQSDWLIGCDY